MDEDRPARGDAPDGLDALDDAALRGVAYGRADSADERMRADRAARILASRGDRLRGQSAATSAAPTGTSQPAAGDGATPGSAARPSDVDDAEPDERPSWWTRSRRIGAGLLATGLALGLAIGIGGERLVTALSPDSLAVFDREPTDVDEFASDGTFGFFLGETRYLDTVGGVDLYAVRTDDDVMFGTGQLGPQICLMATAVNLQFVPANCTPEEVFRTQGMAGTLVAFDTTGANSTGLSTIARVLTVEWGPRGGPRAVDVSDTVLSDDDGPVTPLQRATGEDLPLVQELAQLEVDGEVASALATELPPASLGPALIQSISTDALGQFDLYASLHPEGSEPPQLCATLIVASGNRVVQCTSLDEFRDRGLRVSVDSDGAETVIQFDADAGSNVTIEETTY